MKITITGSLGNISLPLAMELILRGHQVTIISSNQEKKKDIEALGAKAAIGSLADVEFLTKTFSDADAVYCMIPPNFSKTDQVAYYRSIGANYALAIQISGVKRVVHLSSYGAHLEKGTGFILGSHNVEKILNELPGIELTHIRPGYFYYNLLNFIDMIKKVGFIGTNYGSDDKLVLSHPKDIAATIVYELEQPNSDIKVRYIASDDTRASEIASILGFAINKPDLKWLTFTDENTAQAMKERGMPEHLIINFIEMGNATHTGIMREDYDKDRNKFKGILKIQHFASEFAEVYFKK
jgi:uncharacterized protein YbjT (DUF2867 family)